MSATIRFKIKISGNIVSFPKKVGHPNAVVDGTINGLPFLKTPIVNYRMKLSKAMEKAGGESATIEILRVGEEIETIVPSGLTKSLKSNPKAKKNWEDITPTARRDWIFWISSAKQDETYERRIETAISKMNSGMRRVCCFGGIKWLMKTGGK